jgi:DNA-directed RNA polymerase specialized sigma24 family protein
MRKAEFNESDVALSALNSFIDRAKKGSFQQVTNDFGLWKLLKTIAVRKVNDGRKRLYAAKRGGLKHVTTGQSDGLPDGRGRGIEVAPALTRRPDSDLEMSDLFNALLNELSSDRERDVVLLRLQGASFATIAEALQVSTKTVQRILRGIESKWTEAFLLP